MAKLLDDNDDMLTIILVRLPVRSIFRFRCVSKRWNNIISSPFFIQSYNYRLRTKERLLGFIRNTSTFKISCTNYLSSIVPVPPTTNDHKIDTSVKLDRIFLNSSNGLILCLNQKKYPNGQYTLHILNPLTNRNVCLPKPPRLYSSSAVLVCEENSRALSVKYKVFAIGKVRYDFLTMQTFSSDTRKWTTSRLILTTPLCGINELSWEGSSVANAFIHWYTRDRFIAVYDTNDDTGVIQLIEPPSQDWGVNGSFDIVRSSGDDALWFCGRDEMNYRVKTWMISKGEYDSYKKSSTAIPQTKWILVHDFSYEPLYKTILSSQKHEDQKRLQIMPRHSVYKSSILLEVLHVALVECNNRLYLCNTVNNSFEEVEYNNPCPGIYNTNCFTPYLEPLCLSSYAL